MGLDAMILVFWMLSFKPVFSLSSFIFIKRLFRSYSLPSIRVVSSAYLRLLIFLLAILIPACASSSLAFLMTYSAYKLNKQGDSMQPWCTPFSMQNQSVVPCPVLTVASWPERIVNKLTQVLHCLQNKPALHVSTVHIYLTQPLPFYLHKGFPFSFLMSHSSLLAALEMFYEEKRSEAYIIFPIYYSACIKF